MEETIFLENECGILKLGIEKELPIKDIAIKGTALFGNTEYKSLRIEMYEGDSETLITLYSSNEPHKMIVIYPDKHKIYLTKIYGTEQTIYTRINA